MLRTSAAAVALIAQIGIAQADACESLPTGGLLCEQDGAILFVDPTSGTAIDVTQEVLTALAGGDLPDEAAAAPEAPAADGGTFEDRLSGFCADGGCPAGLSGAIDGVTGYIPSYQ